MPDVKESVKGRMAKVEEPSTNGTLEEQRLLTELLTFKRQELSRLQQLVLAEQATLVKTKEEIASAKRQQDYDHRVEREKFLASLEAQQETLRSERRSLEQLDLELEGRRKAVEILEAQAEPIRQARRHLEEERLAIEQQRLRNEQLTVENDRLANSTSALHAEVQQIKDALLKEKVRVSQQAVDQERLQAELDQRRKDIALQFENLTALKTTLDPKLKEIRALKQQSETDREQAKVLHDETIRRQAELDKQRSDLAILSTQLQAKADALTEYDAKLKQTAAELRIRLQQAQMEHGVKVTPQTPPTDLSEENQQAPVASPPPTVNPTA